MKNTSKSKMSKPKASKMPAMKVSKMTSGKMSSKGFNYSRPGTKSGRGK